MRAPGTATRRSHATASCMPAPIAGPLIAAITGAGMIDDRVEDELERGAKRVDGNIGARFGRLEARHEIRARAERRTRTRDHDRAQVAMRVELRPQLVAELAVERVAPFLAVDRREPDQAARLEPDHRLRTRR